MGNDCPEGCVFVTEVSRYQVLKRCKKCGWVCLSYFDDPCHCIPCDAARRGTQWMNEDKRLEGTIFIWEEQILATPNSLLGVE